MERVSPYLRLASRLLMVWAVAWAVGFPAPAHAWVLVIKNLTNEAMSVCYYVAGMASGCFGSLEVPPNGSVPASTGTSCIARIKVTRVRDGLAQVLPRPTGTGCGDRQLSIRRDSGGFTLDAQ